MTHEQQLVLEGKSSIVKGSKSFSLASFFFNQQQKEAAWLLYSWCRFVDDEIDQAPSQEQALLKLQEVKKQTLLALQDPQSTHGPYRSLGLLARQYSIPHQYPLDLIRGMEIDVRGEGIHNEGELLDYCYCVAGTVGLMMCSVMNVKDPRATAHALAMGQAMQLTNIARDVSDDLKIGRIYFPDTWLAELNLTRQNFAQSQQQWSPLVRRLLDLAESSYQQGFAGIPYLNWRAAWAVTIAAFVYRSIGLKIKKDISRSFRERTVVSTAQKILIAVAASLRLPFLKI